jgi:hypothetical protein
LQDGKFAAKIMVNEVREAIENGKKKAAKDANAPHKDKGSTDEPPASKETKKAKEPTRQEAKETKAIEFPSATRNNDPVSSDFVNACLRPWAGTKEKISRSPRTQKTQRPCARMTSPLFCSS